MTVHLHRHGRQEMEQRVLANRRRVSPSNKTLVVEAYISLPVGAATSQAMNADARGCGHGH